MLKISRIEPVNHAVSLRLEGRLVGPWVAELRKSCEEVLAEGQSLKLHLAEVEFADPDGVTLLVELCSRGVSFADSAPFVAEQLKASKSRV